MVNLDRVKELYAEGSGRYRLILADGNELMVSRSYSPLFRRQLL
jgi:DNA-binding LytR/AlgR family response regulator